jgi:hypothetical protein
LKRYCAQSCGECKPTGKKCKDTIKKWVIFLNLDGIFKRAF